MSLRTFHQPVRPGRGVVSTCPREIDFLRQLRLRQSRWLDASYATQRNLWQRAIDDKLLGYVYARSVGVRTPSVLFCDERGVSALPREWPEAWGCCFVIKPLYGFNDFGVMVIEDGIDRFTGTVLEGRDDVARLLRKNNVPHRLLRKTIYVETIVRPEAHYARNQTPPDFKFFTFGGTIGTVGIIAGRKTRGACMAWVDERFQRTDTFGCVCREISADTPCSYGHCHNGLPRKPHQWDKLVQVARKLGELVGVHMRIDLFASSSGQPYLGEFTPWHSNGKMMCDLRPPVAEATPRFVAERNRTVASSATARAMTKPKEGLVRRRDGLTGAVRTVDTCRLGRLWRDAGPEEGGSREGPSPPILRNWPFYMYNERAKCRAAVEHLRPLSWRRAPSTGSPPAPTHGAPSVTRKAARPTHHEPPSQRVMRAAKSPIPPGAHLPPGATVAHNNAPSQPEWPSNPQPAMPDAPTLRVGAQIVTAASTAAETAFRWLQRRVGIAM